MRSRAPRVSLFAWGLLLGAPVSIAQVNDFGMEGVLDVPSARMPEEGTFRATYSRKDVADIYALSYQVLPRLEASFRYTIFNARELTTVPGERCAANRFDICDGLRDRSFEIKVALLRETEYLPAVSAGIRDLLGTGAWGAEYVAASKQFGPLDLSVGLGWGRFAERAIASNPLTEISPSFGNRSGFAGVGGEISFGDFFRGPDIGLFGSVRYRIPAWRLDLLAAYNSDSYARERIFGTIPDADPLSFGVEWDASPGITLGASWQQGNQLALRLTASLDTTVQSPRRAPNRFSATTEPAPVRVASTSIEADKAWWPRFVQDAEASGILVPEAKLEGETLAVQYRNSTYQLEADAVSRVLALTHLYAPPEVSRITVTGSSLGLSTHSVTASRGFSGDSRELRLSAPLEIEDPNFATRFRYPNGKVGATVGLRPYLFDPDFPLLYQAFVKFRGEVDFGEGWTATGSWVQNVKSQFGRIRRGGESALPNVRSLARDYLQQGESGIDDLALVKRGKFARDVYYQTFGGILEEMYTGVGGEVLWRPFGSRWAIGANVIGVRQREFDKLFGLRDYRTVTGHVSAYWASPFYGMDFAVHAGRYLAGDIGATLEIQKRFANGWSLGAFATLTDVPFEVFGEGSFDKGLIFRIPFDPFSSSNVRGRYRAILRSINRDGGRMVDQWPGQLWESMRGTASDQLFDQSPRMAPRAD